VLQVVAGVLQVCCRCVAMRAHLPEHLQHLISSVAHMAREKGKKMIYDSCQVLQCSVLQCSVLQCVAVCCGVLRCVAVCCSALQCVAMCCSVLQ